MDSTQLKTVLGEQQIEAQIIVKDANLVTRRVDPQKRSPKILKLWKTPFLEELK